MNTNNRNTNNQIDTYYKEWIDSILTLKDIEENPARFEYFFHVAEKYYDRGTMDHRNQKFILVGTSIPEELIYAVGNTPLWILGGSLGTFDDADTMVPRDTDAVSQSVLGYLMGKNFHFLNNSTVILPITCDSMRKLAAILQKETNVITIDFPPGKTAPFAKEKWTSQMHRLAEQIESTAKRKITKDSLNRAVRIVNEAREQMRKFEFITRMNRTGISGVMRLFILNTYYFAQDIEEWTRNLTKLNEQIEMIGVVNNHSEQIKPKVLLMGSPTYFPNFKIPFLLHRIGLDLNATVSVMTQKIYTDSTVKENYFDFINIFDSVVWKNYQMDCSSAYTDNTTLFDNIQTLTLQSKFDGVLYHVLKGQIEYDFELNRYEEFFAQQNIPVFRLETDYKYQDIEQLKIRTEAFREMLVQNTYKKERYLV